MKCSFVAKSQSYSNHWKRRMWRTSDEVLSTFEDMARQMYLRFACRGSHSMKMRMSTLRRAVLDGNSSCSDYGFPSFFQVCLPSWQALASVGTPPWAPRSGWLQRLDSCFKTFCHGYLKGCILYFWLFFVFLPDHWSVPQMKYQCPLKKRFQLFFLTCSQGLS